MGVKTKELSQAQRHFVIDWFKQGKTFRLIQEATGMVLGTISDLIKKYETETDRIIEEKTVLECLRINGQVEQFVSTCS